MFRYPVLVVLVTVNINALPFQYPLGAPDAWVSKMAFPAGWTPNLFIGNPVIPGNIGYNPFGNNYNIYQPANGYNGNQVPNDYKGNKVPSDFNGNQVHNDYNGNQVNTDYNGSPVYVGNIGNQGGDGYKRVPGNDYRENPSGGYEGPKDDGYNKQHDQPYVCNRQPKAGSPNYYVETLPDGRVFKRPCPYGTLYSQQTCSCSVHDPNYVPPEYHENQGHYDAGVCDLKPGDRPDSYRQMSANGSYVIRPCAPGTLYNQETCTCSERDPNNVPQPGYGVPSPGYSDPPYGDKPSQGQKYYPDNNNYRGGERYRK